MAEIAQAAHEGDHCMLAYLRARAPKVLLLEGGRRCGFFTHQEVPVSPRLFGARIKRYPTSPEGLGFQPLASVDAGGRISRDATGENHSAEFRSVGGRFSLLRVAPERHLEGLVGLLMLEGGEDFFEVHLVAKEPYLDPYLISW